MVSAGALAGCAASLDSQTPTGSLNSTRPTGAAQQEPKPAPKLAKASVDPKMAKAPVEPKLKSQSASVRSPHPAEKPTSTTTPGNAAYKIGTQDVLDISVFKVPELSRTLQVADAGSVNLPLLGEVTAAGKTTQELERDLTSRLGAKYLESPKVTVVVKEYNSQRVTIEGAVPKPGVYPLRGTTTLLQFIAMAGGIDANVGSSEVAVFRYVDGKRHVGGFDIDQIRAGQAEDPAIRSGDVIVVSTSGVKTAFNNILKALPITGLFAPML
jgi:polysaccharide export outer membrane protein